MLFSYTPLIFVLELTSVGMANITFRPQEQVVLNCALYSYTALLLKYSNFYHHITMFDTHLLLQPYTFVKFETVNLVHILLLHVLFVMNCNIQTVVLSLSHSANLPLRIYTAPSPHFLYFCALEYDLFTHFVTHMYKYITVELFIYCSLIKRIKIIKYFLSTF